MGINVGSHTVFSGDGDSSSHPSVCAHTDTFAIIITTPRAARVDKLLVMSSELSEHTFIVKLNTTTTDNRNAVWQKTK